MDPYRPLHLFPPLPATSDQLAEFDVAQRWQELTKQHEDFGEMRLRPVQPWDTISKVIFLFQVPTGLGFIKNKKTTSLFPPFSSHKIHGESQREPENRDISI